jgi:hypothetical protein
MFIPDLVFFPIPDPGSSVKKKHRIRIRNTDYDDIVIKRLSHVSDFKINFF